VRTRMPDPKCPVRASHCRGAVLMTSATFGADNVAVHARDYNGAVSRKFGNKENSAYASEPTCLVHHMRRYRFRQACSWCQRRDSALSTGPATPSKQKSACKYSSTDMRTPRMQSSQSALGTLAWITGMICAALQPWLPIGRTQPVTLRMASKVDMLFCPHRLLET